MVIVLLAAVYPARRAASYDPVEVIRARTLNPSSNCPPNKPRKPPLLEARNLRRILGAGDTATEILRGVNLVIQPAEYISIVGASGSGKSTLLYLLGGLDRPTRPDPAGKPLDPPSSVFMAGQDTAFLSDTQLALLRNRMVGFVFQFHYLLKEFTAQENVALPMFKLGRLTRSMPPWIAPPNFSSTSVCPTNTSAAQIVSAAASSNASPSPAHWLTSRGVLLADEPTGNLDRRNGELIADIFHELYAAGQTS